jgi:hypothetical protein
MISWAEERALRSIATHEYPTPNRNNAGKMNLGNVAKNDAEGNYHSSIIFINKRSNKS